MSASSMVPSSGNQQSGGNRPVARRGGEMDPFQAIRREMDRVFDDMLRGFGMPSFSLPITQAMSATMLTPHMDVSETDQDIRITAELPGIDEKNLEVMVSDDLLTIRGEKQVEEEEKDRDYRVVERARGSFGRSLRLPFSVDPNQVQASFKDEVLTITVPKPKEVKEKTARVEVKRENGAGGSTSSGTTSGTASSGTSAASQQSRGSQGTQKAAE